MSDLPTIAFAGIGLMGLPMCRRLLAAGYRLVVWNRSSAKCQPLVDLGARAVATPPELCAEAEVVLLCLADTAAVRASSPGLLRSPSRHKAASQTAPPN